MKYLLLIIISLLTLTACSSPYYNFTLSTNEIDIISGETVVVNISIARCGNSDCNKAVKFSINIQLPPGITAVFDPVETTSNSAVLTFSAKENTTLAIGRYTYQIVMTNPYKGPLAPESQEFILNIKEGAI